jgi:hypothetical protein
MDLMVRKAKLLARVAASVGCRSGLWTRQAAAFCPIHQLWPAQPGCQIFELRP